MVLSKKPFCRGFKHVCLKYAATGLFPFFLLIAGFESYAQSYFYFENKLFFSPDSSITYYTFLTLQNNGTAVARILCKEPVSGAEMGAEFKLLDSADTAGSNTHYLIRDGNPISINGTDISGFHSPRFVFKQQTEGKDVFYVPDAINYQLENDTWLASEMIVNLQKSDAELRDLKELVLLFYNETTEFYQYLFVRQPSSRAPARRKEKLYLITVANTLDVKIGVTTQTDMSNIVATFSQMALDLNMDIQIQKIIDISFGKPAVELALAKLNPSPADIVVFYYSGHGFRYANDQSDFPRISLRIGTKPDIDKNNLSLEAIFKTLLKKRAKVTLVISDCCNNNIDAPIPSGSDVIVTKAPPGLKPILDTVVCKRLFFPDKPMSLLIGSADKNQLAAGNPKLGGYFTSVFTVELRKILYGGATNATWISMLASSKKQASWLSLGAECAPDVRCVQSAKINLLP